MENNRDTFSSRLGFILATIGFSVGVGTLWRFPYICGKYGGGLFLLTYIAMMCIIGIPLFSAEVSIGLASRKSPVDAYKTLEKPGAKWHIAGYFHMICIVLVVGYTMGLGAVGWYMGECMLEGGLKKLTVADIDPEAVKRFIEEHPGYDIDACPVGEVLQQDVDILSPCENVYRVCENIIYGDEEMEFDD